MHPSRARSAIVAIVIGAALSGAGRAARAQQPAVADTSATNVDEGLAVPLGIPVARGGSGTSWLPDASSHSAVIKRQGDWELALHGSVYLDYMAVSGTRGAGQLNSVNWVMLGAAHELGGGLLRLRTMLSAEALTIQEPGYPQLLQVATAYQGQTVSDREPPEAPVMELAALYERAVGSDAGLSLYLAPVGEPSLGPVSYLHRPAAAFDPIAPLGHFLQDLSHVSDGVITAGAFTRRLKVEGSVFNSAHPDPSTGYAYSFHLNGYSGRLFWNPVDSWSVSAWAGHLAASTGAHSHDATTRFGASALYAGDPTERNAWTASFVWGAEVPATGGRMINSVLAESSMGIDSTIVVFGRGEWVQRTPAQLALIGAVPPVSDVGALTLGVARRLRRFGAFAVWAGAGGTLTVVSADLEPFYGGQYLLGGLAYLRLGVAGGHSGE